MTSEKYQIHYMYHSGSRQHFLFIIKHDLLLTAFSPTVTVLAKLLRRLTVWREVQFKIRVFGLMGCRPTVKTLILTVCPDRSAVS